jgi:hypothetical protein
MPKAIWYRTGLIATLREYASVSDRLDDQATAVASLRRACEVAAALITEPESRLPCFRKQLVPELHALAEILSGTRRITDHDRALADRLGKWLEEN